MVEDAWVDAYSHEIRRYQALLPDRSIQSIFFGGGTPSLMSVKAVNAILSIVKQGWQFEPNIEITLEANPSSVEAHRFEGYQDAGVNRLSLGIQSLRSDGLTYLGRRHTVEEAITAIHTAKKIFRNISFDLIYAYENQTLKEWEEDLMQALEFNTPHLSLYQLTIEPGTVFAARHQRGELEIPSDHKAADFYELTQELMHKFYMPAYEISNHAKQDYACVHNMTYWTYGEYIGIGAGAHGRIVQNKRRYATYQKKSPEKWLSQIQHQGHADEEIIELTPQEEFEERLLMGMRTKRGVYLDEEDKRYMNLNAFKRLLDNDMLILEGKYLKTKKFPELRLNSILSQLWKDNEVPD